jgi:hypothetical protein
VLRHIHVQFPNSIDNRATKRLPIQITLSEIAVTASSPNQC